VVLDSGQTLDQLQGPISKFSDQFETVQGPGVQDCPFGKELLLIRIFFHEV